MARPLPPPIDIRIVSRANLEGVWSDWLQLSSGKLDETEVLANAVKLALLTDRLADRDEILPDPDSDDYRGWWGDHEAETIWDGWQIGCKNWLLTRAKIIEAADSFEGATLARAEEYTRAALQPLIDKRICTYIDVAAVRSERDRIDVTVVVYRGPRQEIELRFQDLWTQIKVQ